MSLEDIDRQLETVLLELEERRLLENALAPIEAEYDAKRHFRVELTALVDGLERKIRLQSKYGFASTPEQQLEEQLFEAQEKLDEVTAKIADYENIIQEYWSRIARYSDVEVHYLELQHKRKSVLREMILARQDWTATQLLVWETELNTLQLVGTQVRVNEQISQRMKILKSQIEQLFDDESK